MNRRDRQYEFERALLHIAYAIAIVVLVLVAGSLDCPL